MVPLDPVLLFFDELLEEQPRYVMVPEVSLGRLQMLQNSGEHPWRLFEKEKN